MVKREHSFLHFPSKPQIFVPSKLRGMSGNGFRFNENFVKTPKIPIQSQPFLHIMATFFFSTNHLNKKKKKKLSFLLESYFVPVWIVLKAAFVFVLSHFIFFSTATFDFSTVNSAPVYCSRVPQITLFNNFFIKNGSYNTIYTFKNYFATMFSVSVFNFSKNKLYPNRPFM